MTDKKLAKMSLSNWGGLSFKCRCKKIHKIHVDECVIEQGSVNYIAHLEMYMVVVQKIISLRGLEM